MVRKQATRATLRGLPFVVCLLLLALTMGCLPSAGPNLSPGPSTPTATSTPGASPSPTPAGGGNPTVEVVATGLEVPWEIAFAPDGRLFFTERTGNLRVIVGGALLPDPVATLPVASAGESGLMGLALDPSFAQNGYLYLMYTYRDSENQLRNRVSRLTERDNKAGDEQIIFDGIPGGIIHDGGRLKFGPDGKLYVTTGDSSNSQLAQQLDSPAGKILRINPDGSIPEDNPFPGSPVYSYGHRNVQGIDWRPDTGALLASEHGPSGHDEINVIEPGKNYGWPLVTGRGQQQGLVDPILDTDVSIAPSGIAFYRASGSLWDGNLFVATLRGQHLLRLVLSPISAGPPTIEQQERLLDGAFGRLRTVVLGPDGFLYVSTSNRDGRGIAREGDDKILRILPPSP